MQGAVGIQSRSPIPVTGPPESVYTVLVGALELVERMRRIAGVLGNHIVGPVPAEGRAEKAGPLPLQAVAYQLRNEAEVTCKQLEMVVELLGANGSSGS